LLGGGVGKIIFMCRTDGSDGGLAWLPRQSNSTPVIITCDHPFKTVPLIILNKSIFVYLMEMKIATVIDAIGMAEHVIS